MLFNSPQFAIFFVIVYTLYLLLSRDYRWQNKLLLAGSIVFYGYWDWRFLSLLFVTSALHYYCGKKIAKAEDLRKKRFFLGLGVIGSLVILGYFKYYNFFVSNLDHLLKYLGIPASLHLLQIILPLGISFYTFQAMSYTIDVYRGSLKPSDSIQDFTLYVMFFPQLVAGPIERATHLLPQITTARTINLEKFYTGCYLIFWGLFQKVVVADNLARAVDPVFASKAPYNGAMVLLAAYAFTVQIFCDFAGYSNMARGLGMVMGFDIMINFNMPFFATNVQDFWNRWHISLSTWIKDYLYIPLFLSMRKLKANLRLYVAIFLTMVLLGLWHGAAWRFVIFGAYWGILLVLYAMARPVIQNWIKPKNKIGEKIWLYSRILFMFHITVIGMLIFRAQSISQVLSMLSSVMANFHIAKGLGLKEIFVALVGFSWLLVVVEFIQFNKGNVMAIRNAPALVRGLVYFLIYYMFVSYGVEGGKEFIYFQF